MQMFIKPHIRALPSYKGSSFSTDNVIKLNQNESPLDFPDRLKEECFDIMRSMQWSRYPEPTGAKLKQLISESLNIESTQLSFGRGLNQLILSLYQAVCRHGDRVLFPTPSYPLYKLCAKIAELEYLKCPLEDDFGLPVTRLIEMAKLKKPKIVIIANPNNPTGNMFEKLELIEIIKNLNCMVVIDEAYYDFTKKSMIDHIEEHQNLVIMRTFSKAYSLAGLRIGYIISNAALIKDIEKSFPPYQIDLLSLVAATVAVKNRDHIDIVANAVAKEKSRFYEKIDTRKIKVYPSEANFILIKVTDAGRTYRKLVENGIYVRDVSKSEMLDNCLRITIGLPDENDQVIRCLNAIEHT